MLPPLSCRWADHMATALRSGVGCSCGCCFSNGSGMLLELLLLGWGCVAGTTAALQTGADCSHHYCSLDGGLLMWLLLLRQVQVVCCCCSLDESGQLTWLLLLGWVWVVCGCFPSVMGVFLLGPGWVIRAA